MTDDKRQAERVGFTAEVAAYPVVASKSGNIYEVLSEPRSIPAVDISQGGIRLATKQPLDYHSVLKLKIEIQKKRPVDVFARVMWSNQHHSGLKFIVVHEEARRHITHYTHRPH